MKVIVDSSVWSLALRRKTPDAVTRSALQSLIRGGRAVLMGVVRQEVLSGIRDQVSFQLLRQELRSLPDHPLRLEHYEFAAEAFSHCRARGIQGSPTDYLICSVGVIDDLPIYSSDKDFLLYAQYLPIRLFKVK